MAAAKKALIKSTQEPLLFPDSMMPERAELAKHVAEYPHYKHTGSSSCKDAELVFKALELKLLGWGTKRVAKECGVSKWTVNAWWKAADDQGILAPLKKRLSQKAGAIIEDTLDDIHDRVLSGTMPANVLPVVAGILADKKAAWDGDPGMVIEHRHDVSLNVQAVNEFFTKPAIDIQSSVTPALPEHSVVVQPLGVALGVDGAQPGEPIGAELAGEAAHTREKVAVRKGGGGVSRAQGASRRPMELPVENFSQRSLSTHMSSQNPKKSPEEKGGGAPPASAPAASAAKIIVPETPPPAAFSEWQSILPQKLGVSLDIIRQLRDEHLQQGVDYIEHGEGGHLAYTPDAVRRLSELLTKAGPATDETGEQALEQTEVEVIVERCNLTNKRVVLARFADGREGVLTLRVKDASRFRNGMKVKARHFSGSIYELSGPIPKKRA
jgi:hypothetical protein